MPKLLPEPDNFSVTKPVSTAVTAADVASPYMAMAHVLDKSGEALNEFAMAQAKKAGEEAGLKARVDDNGQLVMDPAPFLVGPAMPEYRRAATMSAAIRMQPQIENKMLEMRLEDPDPQIFQRKATKYGQDLVGKIDDPALKVGITKMVSESGAHNYRTALVEANNKNIADMVADYQGQIENNNNRREIIARQGGGPTAENPQGTPEYQGLVGSNMQLYDEMVGDARLKLPQHKADFLEKEQIDRDRIQGVIGDATRIFKSKANIVEAQRYLQDQFLGGGALSQSLGAKKGEAAVAEGLRQLERVSAGDREEISDNRKAVDAWIRAGMHNPNNVTPAALQGLMQRSEDLNDLKSSHLLGEFGTRLDLQKHLQNAGEPERARNLDILNQFQFPTLSGAGIAPPPGGDYSAAGQIDRSSIAEELRQKPELADRLNQMVRGEVGSNASPEVRRIQMETAMNRALARGHSLEQALWDRGAHGDKGYYPTTTFSRGGYSDEVFKGDLDAVLSGSNYAGKHSGGHLITGNASDEPGNTVASNQFRRGTPGFTLETGSGPESYFSEGPFKVKVGGGPVGQPIDFGNPATTRLWEMTREELTKRIAQDAVREHAAIEAKINAGITPLADEITLAVRNAAVSGKAELNEKLLPRIDGLVNAQKIAPEVRTAALSEIRSAMPQASAVQFQMLQTMTQAIEQTNKQAREDPIGLAVQNYGAQPKGPLSFDNPQALAGELSTREKSAATFQANEHTDRPIDVFGPGDAQRVAAALTNGDPKQAGQFLTIMRGALSDPNYVETMSSKPMRDAVDGMTKSNDPQRFVAGMNAMATMYGTHHAEFDSIYGEDNANKLLAWDAVGRPQGGTTPADQERLKEVMQRFNKPLTSAEKQSIKDDIETIDKKRKQMTPENVAYLMGSSYGIPGTQFIGRLTGSIPAVPPNIEGNAADVMRNEFFDLYKSVRVLTPDADTAKKIALQRMKETWGVSTISNTLMKNNPEKFYPKFPAETGTYDWLRTSLDKHMESILGPQFEEEHPISAIPAAGQTAIRFRNWVFQGLISDDQTERERVAGALPSYRIAYTDRLGQLKALPDRYRWDETDRMAAQEELAKKARREFERATPSPPVAAARAQAARETEQQLLPAGGPL